MKNIYFKNLSEEKNETFVFEEDKLLGVKMNNDSFVALSDIPRIFVDLENVKKAVIFYFNKGVSEYIIYTNGVQGIYKCFEIRQELQNGKTVIDYINGVLCIKEKNQLFNIIGYNNAMIKKLLIDDLPVILEKLPFTNNEIEWYRNSIIETLNRKTLQHTTTSQNIKTLQDTTKEKNKIKYTNKNKLIFPLKFEGKTYNSLSALARDYEIQSDTLRMRIKKGMNLEEALTTPIANVGKRLTNIKNIEANKQISIGDEI